MQIKFPKSLVAKEWPHSNAIPWYINSVDETTSLNKSVVYEDPVNEEAMDEQS
jgi:hypothetical protein